MKKRFYFLLIICLAVFMAAAAGAQEAEEPEYHTVVKGDTLWDITYARLDDSFLWPQVWKFNPQIKNPDLIYPGNRIRIPSKEELMRMMATEEEVPVVAELEPLPLIPLEKPKEYIVSKDLYIASGWLSGEFPSIGEIVSSPSGKTRTMFGQNDHVYLDTPDGSFVGDRFFVIKDIKKVKHPKTGRSLGHQIRIAGIIEVIGMDGEDHDVPRAEVLVSYEDIAVGNGLMPYTEMESPVLPDKPGTPDVEGYLVETYTNAKMVGEGEVVYLDKGEDDGLAVGDTFSALSKDPVERVIGKLRVFSLQPTTSAAVILTTQDDEIKIGD
ncbi:MAG TPA: LysM peptidoglycan-binding domain-containing protein, partial [Nitrospirae bacterium]|nr:LysM peptidoglycan-binding domain-containing protein [Nitrospirota bacterium]